MARRCATCRFLRVVLLGCAGALAASWIALQLGVDRGQLIMPATVGALLALALGVLLSKRSP